MKKTLVAVGAVAAAGAALWLWPSGKAQGPSMPEAPPLKIDPATAGTISGVVRYEGPAPEAAFVDMSSKPECHALHPQKVPDDKILVKDGLLANAVVYVKSGLPKGSFPIPSEPFVLDQKGCLFLPRVSAVRVGQPVRFLNSDPTKHNVKTDPEPKEAAAFNVSLQTQGSSRNVQVDAAEVGIHLVCDYHGWMSGWISAFDHPFFAVTGGDGAFELKGLPPGEYEVEAWHETLGARSGKARVEPKGSATLDLAFR